MNNFYISLSSSDFKTNFSQNNWLRFTNLLQPPLNLMEGYEVSLVGFYVTGKDIPSRFVSVCSNIVGLQQHGESISRTIQILSLTNPIAYLSRSVYVDCLPAVFYDITIEVHGLKQPIAKVAPEIDVQLRLHFRKKQDDSSH